MTQAFKADSPDWQKRHLDAYLETDGENGHFVDFTPVGGPPEVPCLLLETIGRKSGEPQPLPLIYGEDGDDFIIVASRGGASAHPAWYLNLEAQPEVKVQVAAKKYEGVARTVPSPDRERLFAIMAEIYPPYVDYQQKTDREIPVVAVRPTGEIERI
jgi:deazaflavin-dependent oxidoreductase (nitroreductase family)